MEAPTNMDKIQYLSPSAFKLFEEDAERYYKRYLAPVREPRQPQTRPMAIGSSFDAYVKSYLYEHLIGPTAGTDYELETIFKQQVDEDVQEWAWEEGRWLFEVYKDQGALADLMLELSGHFGTPRFEFKLKGVIATTYGEVTLLGKPDLYIINSAGHPVILDFKVTGYCGKYNKSPDKGYLKLRPVNRMHKDCIPLMYNGMMINSMCGLEDSNAIWAMQTTVYGWLLGNDVGKEVLVGIDQIACNGAKRDEFDRPEIRIASHRATTSRQWQIALFERMVDAWRTINSDHFFRNMSEEASQRYCDNLDRECRELNGEGNEDDVWFSQATNS